MFHAAFFTCTGILSFQDWFLNYCITLRKLWSTSFVNKQMFWCLGWTLAPTSSNSIQIFHKNNIARSSFTLLKSLQCWHCQTVRVVNWWLDFWMSLRTVCAACTENQGYKGVTSTNEGSPLMILKMLLSIDTTHCSNITIIDIYILQHASPQTSLTDNMYSLEGSGLFKASHMLFRSQLSSRIKLHLTESLLKASNQRYIQT